MKIVYVLASTIDDKILVNSTNNLKRALKPYQKKKKVGQIEINLWDQLCQIEFKDDKRAENFKDFLQSDAGQEFIITHLARNPLPELKKLISVLPKSVPYYIIGGLAIDGYMGKLTRMHNDADLMCWRKDLKSVEKALDKIGYKVNFHYFKDNHKKAYYIETKEENPIISFLIMDELPKNKFEISLGKMTHQVFPKSYLGSKKVKINNLEFPVVKLELIDFLNKKTKANLYKIKKDNPSLFNILGTKVINNKHDRQLLNQLKKK